MKGVDKWSRQSARNFVRYAIGTGESISGDSRVGQAIDVRLKGKSCSLE